MVSVSVTEAGSSKRTTDAKVPMGLHRIDIKSLSEVEARTSSPTAVNDERLLLPHENNDSEKTDDRSFLPIIPVQFQQKAIESYSYVHGFVQDQHNNFVLDRKTITTMILSVIASVLGFIGVAITSLGGLAILSCPIWLPVALLTLPLWLPLMLFTSPVWVTAIATLFCCVLGTCAFVLTLAFFFTWPEEWLPSKESSNIVCWYLKQRNTATVALAKLQAKFLLYAAGVGPATDAIFVIMDKVDVQALTTKLQHVDWKDMGRKIQRRELNDVRMILFEIFASLIP